MSLILANSCLPLTLCRFNASRHFLEMLCYLIPYEPWHIQNLNNGPRNSCSFLLHFTSPWGKLESLACWNLETIGGKIGNVPKSHLTFGANYWWGKWQVFFMLMNEFQAAFQYKFVSYKYNHSSFQIPLAAHSARGTATFDTVDNLRHMRHIFSICQSCLGTPLGWLFPVASSSFIYLSYSWIIILLWSKYTPAFI